MKIYLLFLFSQNINNYNFPFVGYKVTADNFGTRMQLHFFIDNETLSVTNFKSTTTSQIGNFLSSNRQPMTDDVDR